MKLKVIAFPIAAISLSSMALLLHAAPPESGQGLHVDITSPADGSRQSWNSQVPYSVTASYEGKSTKFGELPTNDVVVSATYVSDANSPSARRSTPLPEALALISQSNCTGCHDFTSSSAGPSFAAIGSRYAGKPNATSLLAEHIREGSKGAWGSGAMPPHPDLSPAQATAIAQWITSLGNSPNVQYSIGKNGSFRMAATGKVGPHAGVVLSAFYSGSLKPGDSRVAAGRDVVVVYGSGS